MIHNFISLHEIRPFELERTFGQLYSMEVSSNINFKTDDYEWIIGENILAYIERWRDVYDFDFFKNNKICGVGVKAFAPGVRSNEVCLCLRQNDYYDTDDAYNNYRIEAKNLDMPILKMKKLEIKNVIFSGPCTIVLWSDGDKTIVRCRDDEAFDKEKGLAMAIVKKCFGTNKSKSNFNDIFKKWIPKEEVVDDSFLADLFLGAFKDIKKKKNEAMTVKEYCDKYHCARKKVYDMIEDGVLIAYKNEKGMWQIYE